MPRTLSSPFFYTHIFEKPVLWFLFTLLLPTVAAADPLMELTTANAVSIRIMGNTTNNINDEHDEHHHTGSHKDIILSSIIWVLETPHVVITTLNADDKTRLLSVVAGGVAATTINVVFWFKGNQLPGGFAELLDLLGHAAISYIVFNGINMIGTRYYSKDYIAAKASGVKPQVL